MAEQLFQVKLSTPIEKTIAQASPLVVEKAMRRTVIDITKRARTGAFQAVPKIYNLKQSELRAKFKNPNPRVMYSQKGSVHIGMMNFASTRFSLINFSPSIRKVKTRIGIRRAVSVKVRRDHPRKTVRRKGTQFAGFVGVGRAGQVQGAGAKQIFIRYKQPVTRSRADRFPIHKASTKAPSMMLMARYVEEAMNRRVLEKFNPTLEHHLNFYMSRAKR